MTATATTKTIAPITKRGNAYFVDTSELLGDSCLEYGPYETRAEAEEDRGPVVERIKVRRKLGIKAHEPAFEISAGTFKLAVQMLGRMTKGSMRVSRLKPDQRKVLALMLYKWKGPGTLGEETLERLDTLKQLFYRECGINPSWPGADDAFAQWAINYTKD